MLPKGSFPGYLRRHSLCARVPLRNPRDAVEEGFCPPDFATPRRGHRSDPRLHMAIYSYYFRGHNTGRRVEKGITSALPRVSDGFLFRPGKEDHPLLGAAAGPTPGSWHKGPTWSAYFRDTTLGGAVPLWSMVGVKPGPEMQACRVDEAHLAPRFL